MKGDGRADDFLKSLGRHLLVRLIVSGRDQPLLRRRNDGALRREIEKYTFLIAGQHIDAADVTEIAEHLLPNGRIGRRVEQIGMGHTLFLWCRFGRRGLGRLGRRQGRWISFFSRLWLRRRRKGRPFFWKRLRLRERRGRHHRYRLALCCGGCGWDGRLERGGRSGHLPGEFSFFQCLDLFFQLADSFCQTVHGSGAFQTTEMKKPHLRAHARRRTSSRLGQ